MPTVIIYWSPDRTTEQKADVIHHITEALVEFGGARREDVLIIFQEIQPGDAGRGGKLLHSTSNTNPLPQDDPAPTNGKVDNQKIHLPVGHSFDSNGHGNGTNHRSDS